MTSPNTPTSPTEAVERARARFSGRNIFNAPHRMVNTGEMGRLVGFIIPDEGGLGEQSDDLRSLLASIPAGGVEEAYREGWRDSENSTNGFACIQEDDGWKSSKARAALNPETSQGGDA